MPTKLPHYTITETPDVRAALDDLRREIGEQRVQLAELVVLGAQEKTCQVQAERAHDDEPIAGLAACIVMESRWSIPSQPTKRRTGCVHE